jgi:hypothetical protein
MSNFPSLRPATRQFSFGEYPVSMQTGFGGGTVRFLHGIGRSAVVMELTFQNLTQAEAKLIRDHYRIRQGSHQDFLLPDALWAGHSGTANIVPRLTRWKYGSQPEETQKRGGYVDLTVSLISVTVITSMDVLALGMSRTLTLALSAGSATGGGGGGGGGTSYRYWRFDQFTHTAVNVLEIGEFVLVNAGVYVSSGSWSRSDDNWSTSEPIGTAATDGVLTSRAFQLSTSTWPNRSVQYDHGSPVTATGFKYASYFQSATRYITGVRVRGSNDGTTFTDITTFSGLTAYTANNANSVNELSPEYSF